jgi:hypothetical protein
VADVSDETTAHPASVLTRHFLTELVLVLEPGSGAVIYSITGSMVLVGHWRRENEDTSLSLWNTGPIPTAYAPSTATLPSATRSRLTQPVPFS